MANARTAPAAATGAGLVVGVCADERFLLERICAALAAGGHTVFSRAVDPTELAEAREEAAPDAVVLAARRPDGRALVAARGLRGHLGERTAIVLVCERSSSGDVRKAMEAGLDGLVLSADLEDVLAGVVSVVCAGQVSVPRAQREEIRAPILTGREKQILGLVVMGLTNAQIAGKLFLAESTVKSHLSSAFSKLGVSSRNEAVALILDPQRGHSLGILTIPAEPVPSPA